MILPGSRAGALAKITELIREHHFSLDEIGSALETVPAQETRNVATIMSKIMSYLGAVFVFSGLAIYTAIEWDQLSSLSRVIITLGPGIVCFILGILCLRDPRYIKAATPLFVLGAFLQPTGLIVYLDEYFEPTGNTALALSLVFGLIALQQAAAFKICRRTVLLFFTAVYSYTSATLYLIWLNLDERLWGSLLAFSALCTTYAISKTSHRVLAPWFSVAAGFALICASFQTLNGNPAEPGLILLAGYLYGLVLLAYIRTMAAPHPVFLSLGILPYLAFLAGGMDETNWARPEWIALLTGSAGLLIAYGLTRTTQKKASPFLYFVCGFATSCGVHEVLVETPFEVLMVGFGAGLMYLSVVLASRTLLFVSVVTLLGYLASFTDRYFADVVGWPIALIGLGLALILISSYAVKLSQKISAQPKPH